jgi:hypothetical protein
MNTTYDDVRRYLADREARGVNSLVMHLVESLFADDAPRNKRGVAPFRADRLDEPIDPYFDHARQVVEACHDAGFLVVLNPMPLGYRYPNYPGKGRRPEGWHREVLLTGVEGVRAYGRYIAERFGDLDNVVWLLAGDRDPTDVMEHELAVAEELWRARPTALMSAHCHPESRPLDQFPDARWLNLNNAYSYEIVHQVVREEWRRSPTHPVFLFESTYEGEHEATAQQVRRQAWWTMTSGGCGQNIGSRPLWMFEPGWQDIGLDTSAARAMTVLRDCLDRLDWWRLEPAPYVEAFLVGGVGELRGLDTATVAWTAERDLVTGYVPTSRAVDVNLSTLAAGRYVVRTLDPVTGIASASRHVRAAGTWRWHPPEQAADWAFVVAREDVWADLAEEAR